MPSHFERFNPLPVIKPGVTGGFCGLKTMKIVSIHSRLLSRELRFLQRLSVKGDRVSIHSRLLSRELRPLLSY
ncbi:protein of unknown function [Methylocaldum szegediense]|uniref:HTH LytTR-type domain-containing protein n=1 Tax=Methylocaldum szegediense TaxID=73780 RepID=A0ABM9I953_9GAMM|nr:protein of unknown function [Methylocaldum szegediense]